MKRYPFNTIYVQAMDQYGAELDPNIFESIGLTAWHKIGNREIRLYNFSDEPEYLGNDEWSLALPCNVDQIEAVTSEHEDWQSTSNENNHLNMSRGSTEQYIEHRKRNTNPLYPHGGYIKYERVGNTLYFKDKYNLVNVLYKGFISDDEGLPFLTETEVEAIATFCVYTQDFKDARISRDRSTLEMASFMENKWKQLCTQARIPELINQNEMDEVLNASNSWDRKRFGKSFKPIR